MHVGIEAMNVFGGTAYLDVNHLVEHRGLDTTRFANLLMKQKSVPLPFEDPVTYGANAALPIIQSLTEREKNSIELVITCSESGIDFGKSMSTYLQQHLGLHRYCRMFELKQACYSGTAGLQMAANFILSQASPGAKALVIATDVARFMLADGGDALTKDWSYAEPSNGGGAVALLISDEPHVFRLDVGASGYYGYEVMDPCRPGPDIEAGDSDLSLLSYLDCCENTFNEYCRRVADVDYAKTFQYLAFHTPFGGMIKGAHRTMMRKFVKAKADEIELDFEERVVPGLLYCQRVGNIMGATALMSLASIIDHGDYESAKRIGCFSYGSGCCSEFYSGLVNRESQSILRKYAIERQLNERYCLSMAEYDYLLNINCELKFGTRNITIDDNILPGIKTSTGDKRLKLRAIREYHREYEWVG